MECRSKVPAAGEEWSSVAFGSFAGSVEGGAAIAGESVRSIESPIDVNVGLERAPHPPGSNREAIFGLATDVRPSERAARIPR
jgi:hypothetical protein